MQNGILKGHGANGKCPDTAGWAAVVVRDAGERCLKIRKLHGADIRACQRFFGSLDPHDVSIRGRISKVFSADLFSSEIQQRGARPEPPRFPRTGASSTRCS